ncbi:hypothetical protein J3454_08640 [Erythrobacter sp. NFXS35]|uniref:hypothetical protein n=1 Tax=Erythrobacter sp. NFXS35 TaxID=2818436 RepID=UPI0032DF407E
MFGAASLSMVIVAQSMAAPIAQNVIEIRGSVPVVCALSSESFARAQGILSARLSVFCNQREGASVTGTLLDGDPAGYLISNGRTTIHVELGSSFEIATYANAYAGQETVTVSPVSGTSDQSPVLLFDIRAEA